MEVLTLPTIPGSTEEQVRVVLVVGVGKEVGQEEAVVEGGGEDLGVGEEDQEGFEGGKLGIYSSNGSCLNFVSFHLITSFTFKFFLKIINNYLLFRLRFLKSLFSLLVKFN